MAAIAYGCGSPRHQDSINLSTVSVCKPSISNQHHQPNQNSLSMYPSLPKYSRSPSQPSATPNHHHVYGSNNGNSAHQYKKPSPLPSCVSYLPISAVAQQPNQYGVSQRPVSATATTVENCRSFLPHASGTSMIYRSGRHNSRKSAVELLAESKPFYVKSEAVMDRLKQSSYRSNITGLIGCGSKRSRNSLDSAISDRFNASYAGSCLQTDMERSFSTSSPLRHSNGGRRSQQVHHHHHHGNGRRSAAPSNNLLQSKLRKLLNIEGGKELCSQRLKERNREEFSTQFDFPNQISVGSYSQEHHNSPMLIPQSFLSPQSLPLHPDSFDDIFKYGVEEISTEGPLILTDDYRAISPPAEYAADTQQANNEQRSRFNYQRSYSHSHEMAVENKKTTTDTAFNINSHKSLPDLHSQISRHSPHSEILSCCSRGNRSIKSTGESSLNRDSGGSSGHYTHRSEPCYKQRECEREGYDSKMMCTSTCSDYRRDSGSSTQHSANSYCGYPLSSYRNVDCAECHAKNSLSHMDSSDFLLNFTTPEVPEAFQDDYSPPSPSVTKYPHIEQQRYSNVSSHQQTQLHLSQAYEQQRGAVKHSQNTMLQSPGSAPSLEDLSPPPIQFKRQKCIRFKNRPRISLPRAANPNEMQVPSVETYHRNSERPSFFFPKSVTSDAHYKREPNSRRNSQQSIELGTPRKAEGVSELEKFFDRLGLNDDKFHEIYSPPKRRHSAEADSDESSTVFFSDVSTVDSMRLPDSTETQPQTAQTYRPSEPPSIVERNARIIKWLCNCKKLQYS